MRGGLAVAVLVLALISQACKAPQVPPETEEAKFQELLLRRAGAPVFAPEIFGQYKKSLERAKERLWKENAKLIWFRKYEPLRYQFREILIDGERILKELENQKKTKADILASQLTTSLHRIDALRRFLHNMDERGLARAILMRAEMMAREANLLLQRGDMEAADQKLEHVNLYVEDVKGSVFSSLSRYNNRALLSEWRKMAEDAISESRQRGTWLFVINKLERKLTVYDSGVPVDSYTIGLGQNGLSAKLHEGDYATPEGKYRIFNKLSSSQHYKALLIDYPNQEDLSRFSSHKSNGLIPPGLGLGGMIEIHGGGDEMSTDGCISLKDSDVDKIFDKTDIGTPVVIVGSLCSLEDFYKR